MQAYHFLSALNAVDNLKERRIKISRLEDLNDPFELMWMELPDKEDRKAFRKAKKNISAEYGVICFSKDWSNPVLWSHYAEKHRGVCLGFDIPDDSVIHVQYTAKRPVWNIRDGFGRVTIDKKSMNVLLETKYKAWEYEDEIRILVELKEQDKIELYFKEFDKNFVLREVVLGARCQKDMAEEVQSALRNYEKGVNLIQGRLSFKSFKIVKDKLRTRRFLNHKSQRTR